MDGYFEEISFYWFIYAGSKVDVGREISPSEKSKWKVKSLDRRAVADSAVLAAGRLLIHSRYIIFMERKIAIEKLIDR